MSDCVQSSLMVTICGTKFRQLGQVGCNSKFAFLQLPGMAIQHFNNLRVPGKRAKPLMNLKLCCMFDSNGIDFSSELRLKEEKDDNFELGSRIGGDKMRELAREHEADDLGLKNLKKENHKNPKNEGFGEGGLKGESLFGVENGKSKELEGKEEVQLQPKGKQLMKRSNLLAKQVIGIQSALSFGFVSQLWVDTTTWVVLELEVRPNLLSSESGKFLLEDIKQIGDVLLVPDDRVMLNEFRTAGLESLVGYNVVTPVQGRLGKVRGYTFDINSGSVESLELDAFGYSIIPSSLVSTYALSAKDVLDVVSDTVIVHEAAASRIQRLTKGFLGTKSMGVSSIQYSDVEEEYQQPSKGRRPRRKSNKRKSQRRISPLDDDLDLPMDYM